MEVVVCALDMALVEANSGCVRVQPDVFLVGAYEDSQGCGAAVLADLLELLQQHARPCRVRLFCCGALNTSSDGSPQAQGVSYHTATGACHCPPPDSPPGVQHM